jgi:hypothetical protein
MGEPLCGVAAQQFIKPTLWGTIKLAEAGVNLETIIDDSGADTLRARHFAAGDKFFKHGPADADIPSRFVGAEAARGEIYDDALAGHAAALVSNAGVGPLASSIMRNIIRFYDYGGKF